MNKEILKNEEFYKSLFNASWFAVNTYHKYASNKNELIDVGIDYVLENIGNTFDLTGEKKADFNILIKKCLNGIANYKNKNSNEVDFQVFSEEENFLPFLYCDFPDDVECENLKNLLFQFLQTYNLLERKIILVYLKYQNQNEVSRNLQIGIRTISSVIKSFREDFANYLLNCGYLENLDVLKGSKSEKQIAYCKKSLLRQRGVLSYDSYLNDFKIYKLLREEKDLKKFADCIDKSVEYLDKVIYHKVKKLNLTFYEIQKLRVRFFSNYPFLKLVEVD